MLASIYWSGSNLFEDILLQPAVHGKVPGDDHLHQQPCEAGSLCSATAPGGGISCGYGRVLMAVEC